MSILRFIKNLFRPPKGPNYLIEFRFQGYASNYLRQNIWDVSKKFRVKGVTGKKVVPHISLIGPFKTKKQREIVSRFVKVCKKYEWIRFKLSGFDHFDNKVIYVDVNPSNKLVEFRQELFKELEPVIFTVDTDYLKSFAFHSTIAFKDIERKFDKIWSYLDKRKPKTITQVLLRVTLLKGSKILYEYDFPQKRLLNRKQALNKKITRKTIAMLKENKNNR